MKWFLQLLSPLIFPLKCCMTVQIQSPSILVFKQICDQNASFLLSTSITTKILELYGFTSFISTVQLNEPLMFCAIVDSLGYFCLMGLLFLSGFFSQITSLAKVNICVTILNFFLALLNTFYVVVCALVRSIKYLMESPAYLATAT